MKSAHIARSLVDKTHILRSLRWSPRTAANSQADQPLLRFIEISPRSHESFFHRIAQLMNHLRQANHFNFPINCIKISTENLESVL